MDEEDALVRVLIRERSSIIAYARSIVFSRELAEEVYQNVAVVVLRKRDQASGLEDLLRWILGVTRLESLAALRKLKSGPKPFEEGLLDLLDTSWEDQIKKQKESLEGVRAAALQNCIGKLTERGKRILRLRYAEGISGSELAERLDMQLNTAYVALSRIHKQLRNCVEARQSRSQS